ncbi:MAG: LPS export ABC transporter periplasmic protein LptC [Fibrobacter sp.]|jgi:LPS export ABC transporter protein LptC|nr:LPS export ABC transporter periplasmic protein LptC [Fibrobacter sp.]
MNSRMYFISSVLFLIVISCSGKKESLPVSNEGIEVPFQEFGQAALYFYNKDYVQWKLESEIMRKPITDTGHILVTPVRLTMFDSVGNATTRVLSDSGSTDGSMESFIVWGNVFIRARDSLVIRTERLWWNKGRRKVESDTFVQIETKKGDVLRGKGLDAVEDFSIFSFKSDVSGKFPDFKERMESNEEQVF